ncbi:MATE family efflux transporter [Myxococcota bacterium]|nr:MATE family efflux transporter [Myxococcota bacterium]MBU1432879.1 MATE family efflux transporter [Myxococcota bacterium]MBU1898572.1 MATE family efflux transporter [Myxococcota bacterium]
MPLQAPLTQGSILRPLLHLTLPFFVGHVFNLLTLVIDRLWVGQLGTEALAALGIAHVSLMLLFTLAFGVGVGTLAGVARLIGARQPQRAAHHFAQGLWLSLLFGLIFAGLAWPAPPWIMDFMGAERGVFEPAAAYLKISMWGLLINAPLFVLTFALQGAGEGKAAMRVASVAPILNGLLDPLFIFTLGGGVPGAATATVLANALALIYGVGQIRHRVPRLRPRRVDLRLDGPTLWGILRIGAPSSVEHLVRNVAGFSLVKILAGFGATVVSAYTAAMVVMSIVIFPGLSVGQATASLVGQNLGADEAGRAWRTAWAGVGVYSVGMLTLGIFTYLGADHIIAAFDHNPAVIIEGGRLLRIFCLSFPFIAPALVLSKAFGGAGHTVPPMGVAALAHLAFQLPAAVYLSQRFGSVGSYWAMSGAFTIHGLASMVIFTRRYRRAWSGC